MTEETKCIKIKYFNKKHSTITQVPGSDWIDLYTAEDEDLKAGDFKYIPLGVAMKIPDGMEAILTMRSSTYKKYGLIQTNAIGVIDNSYCGEDDEWKVPAKADRDIVIPADTRICQFRIQYKQPVVKFDNVDHLSSISRGGFGSTGD